MQISFAMLIFPCFRTKFQGGKVSEGENCLRWAPPAPVEKSQKVIVEMQEMLHSLQLEKLYHI